MRALLYNLSQNFIHNDHLILTMFQNYVNLKVIQLDTKFNK